jgi:hypothetical protein
VAPSSPRFKSFLVIGSPPKRSSLALRSERRQNGHVQFVISGRSTPDSKAWALHEGDTIGRLYESFTEGSEAGDLLDAKRILEQG